MNFGFDEKVLVILHGLPVLDHKVYFLVVFVLCVGHGRFLITRGAFGDWRIWSLNALTHFDLYVNSFLNLKKFFSEIWKKRKKKEPKKSGNSGSKSFRDCSIRRMEVYIWLTILGIRKNFFK